jgi:hypothetical protein
MILPNRPWFDVLQDWVPELAKKLNRSEDALLARGLGATDFSPAKSVEVRFPDGATHRYTFAFAVVRPAANLAAVFSEHSGYLEFSLVDDAVVAEIHEHLYWHKEQQ